MRRLGNLLILFALGLNLSAVVMLLNNYLVYLIVQEYLSVILFIIGLGIRYVQSVQLTAWIGIIKSSIAFSLLNVLVGVVINPRVQALASRTSMGALSFEVDSLATLSQILPVIGLNLMVIVSLSLMIRSLINNLDWSSK